ncbi:uncharacterized protein ColSpa_03561 [Colletotrichum spaethianum]|uniref:Uncharacterized protein n=1 Tax=Colletotrichum spaethianum TaxID=700344 RepID=A0AA37LB90_9PEZI|nr:uncharacterized protein ColSpa_03561 [Colletotrichum spaethianum]GKT43380.1 hypothetical protein ColSpa_03561 [Colletotrichum spaethianum]
MGYYQGTTPGQSWDPRSVLQFDNPQVGYQTCFGTAITYGRRCRRQVSIGPFIPAKLQAQEPLKAAKSSWLNALALDGLCWQHVHQVDDVIARWRHALHKFAETQSAGTKSSSKGHGPKPSTAGSRPTPKTEQRHPDVDDIMEQIRRLREELEKLLSEQKSSSSYSSGPKPSAQQPQQQDHAEEQRRREESEEKAREARKREDSERAERARAKRQKEKEREEREWSDACARYEDRWSNIEAGGGGLASSQIPWPTKSGKGTTVDERAVREFFRRMPSLLLSDEPGEERFRVISRETKRWHPDKLQVGLGGKSSTVNTKTTLMWFRSWFSCFGKMQR